MEVWVLSVFLLSHEPTIIHKKEVFKTRAECIKYLPHYNRHPFQPICERKNKWDL
jgi:hypothetical protein